MSPSLIVFLAPTSFLSPVLFQNQGFLPPSALAASFPLLTSTSLSLPSALLVLLDSQLCLVCFERLIHPPSMDVTLRFELWTATSPLDGELVSFQAMFTTPSSPT